MISRELFEELYLRLALGGHEPDDDITWSEGIKPPDDPIDFALEVAFVICNSGMRNTIAVQIFHRCRKALLSGSPVANVFGHVGKAAAIEKVWAERGPLLDAYNTAADKLAFLVTLPWIGDITKYHLAKNFGVNCVKPDVHLTRLAAAHETTPHELCADLAAKTGYCIATIDTLLWRACANGVLDSRTGALAA